MGSITLKRRWWYTFCETHEYKGEMIGHRIIPDPTSKRPVQRGQIWTWYQCNWKDDKSRASHCSAWSEYIPGQRCLVRTSTVSRYTSSVFLWRRLNEFPCRSCYWCLMSSTFLPADWLFTKSIWITKKKKKRHRIILMVTRVYEDTWQQFRVLPCLMTVKFRCDYWINKKKW